MKNLKPFSEKNEKILILAIDFDDDIGSVGIKTPIIGYEQFSKSAFNFAKAKPEDSDVNVLFEALKVYEELRDEGKNVEIALIAGDSRGSYKAGIKLRNQLLTLVKEISPSGVILVTDGAEDETVIPIVQSILPIYSNKVVVVEQMRGVEETYILLGRYLKKIIEEPRFAKVFIGWPGFIIFVIAILSYFNLAREATFALFTLIGLLMILKGFNIDKRLSFIFTSPVMRISFLLSLAVYFFAVILTYMLVISVESITLHTIFTKVLNLVLPYYMVPTLILIGTKTMLRIIRKSIKFWKDVITLSIILFLWYLLNGLISAYSTLGPQVSLIKIIYYLESAYVLTTTTIFIIVILSISLVMSHVEKEMRKH